MASQNDIARAAGVSQSVVSRVLNGRAAEFGIAAATVARVEQVANALGYRPDPAATMLLGRASRLVGVAVRSFDDPFLATILQELNRRARAAGCTLLVTGLEDGGDPGVDAVRQLQRYRPDALIVVGTTDFSAWPRELFATDRPLVQIGLPSADARVLTCGIDEPAAATALLRHLHTAGHARLAVVGDATAVSASRARLLAEAATALGVALPADQRFLGADPRAAGPVVAARLIAETPADRRPTAVVATDDLLAVAFIQALAAHGLAVPTALAVAGYDDVPLASLARPALTTIRQPVRELAAAAMDLATGHTPPANTLLPGELIVRASSARA